MQEFKSERSDRSEDTWSTGNQGSITLPTPRPRSTRANVGLARGGVLSGLQHDCLPHQTKVFFDSLKQLAVSIRIYLMNNPNHTLTTIIVSIACLALCQQVQSATDTPDPGGSLPVSNTADGHLALASVTTGIYNAAFGIYSLLSLTDGRFCTGVGAGTLLLNTADENTAVGAGALLSNSTGSGNTANGVQALESNTEGFSNTAIGDSALFNNTIGNGNTATGSDALASNSEGTNNTATGIEALSSNTIGSDNAAHGAFALFANTEGMQNTANGEAALENNIIGNSNTVSGFDALLNNTVGNNNTATGVGALGSNTKGNGNTANGVLALAFSTGDGNTANGFQALFQNTAGTSNTAIGSGALVGNTIGVQNTALGVAAGSAVSNASNVICIGFGVPGANVSNSCYVGNIFGQQVAADSGTAVFVDADGKLGTVLSSRRFKHDIKPMDKASETILALKPVTFHYNSDAKDTPQFGLIAEEVAEVNPDLAVRDKKGELLTVRYDAVNAMLLNEFLKEHRTVQEQEATIAELKSGMKTLAATVKEQAAQIQKVSAQVELNRPMQRVASKR